MYIGEHFELEQLYFR